MKTALVLRHPLFENLGNLEASLEEKNYTIEYVEAPTADFSLFDPLKPDLVVILGGPIGVYEEEIHPFITSEIDFVKRRLEKQLPTLGICFGSQLIAFALGSRVYRGHQKEIGWGGLHLTKAGSKSVIRHLEGTKTKVLHWHGDTFDLPEQATLLASSDVYTNQAYMVGNFILGVQFHPEILPNAIEAWLVAHTYELKKAQIDFHQLRDETEQHIYILNEQAKKMWNEWLALINSTQLNDNETIDAVYSIVSD